ncbi:MAG: hypothetical protein PVI75_03835 [Gammaproteobacteria bacterium]|jgi:hypothetical protein
MILKFQYIKYLEIKQGGLTSRELKFLKKLIPKIREHGKDGGFCYFNALQHAVMYKIGKGAWLEDLRKHLSEWDGEMLSLKKKIKLKDSEKKYTLANLFERQIQCLLYHYGCLKFCPSEFIEKDISEKHKFNQTNFIKHYLQISVKNKKNHTIKKIGENNCVKIAGYFTINDIVRMLESETLKNNVTILHAVNHTFTVRYDRTQKKYCLYDHRFFKNFKQNEIICNSAKDCAQRITRWLKKLKLGMAEKGASLVFEFVSLNNKKIEKPINILKQKKPESFLDGFGLHVITRHTPGILTQIITSVQKKPESLVKIAEALPLQDKIFNVSGLQNTARYAPGALIKLLSLAKSNKILMNKIIEALPKLRKGKLTGLHYMARFAPKALEELLKLAENNQALFNKIINILPMQDSQGWSSLHLMIRFAPIALGKLVTLAIKKGRTNNGYTLYNKIVKTLSKKTNRGKTALHMMKKCTPEVYKKLQKHFYIFKIEYFMKSVLVNFTSPLISSFTSSLFLRAIKTKYNTNNINIKKKRRFAKY